MRKSALLLALIFAATAPTLAAAKSSKSSKSATHHARAAKAAPVAAAPADPNTAFFRALNDMTVGLGKTYPAKGGRGGAGE
jgi:hypothetical protein